jgi:hypothetical protein
MWSRLLRVVTVIVAAGIVIGLIIFVELADIASRQKVADHHPQQPSDYTRHKQDWATQVTAASEWLDRHREWINVISTIFVAAFTGTLWAATRRLAHFAETQAGDMQSLLRAARENTTAAASQAEAMGKLHAVSEAQEQVMREQTETMAANLSLTKRATDAAQTSADAAKKAAGVAERALIAVERPILIVSIQDNFQIQIGRPKFCIGIENVGKQVANTNGVTASMTVQKDSNFPTFDNPHDGSTCTTVPVMGQHVITPSTRIDVTCQRQRPLTEEEVRDIKRDSHVFLRVTIIYGDTVGNDRITIWVALLRTHGDIGRFVQIFSADHVNETLLTAEQQEQNQRALIDTILQIEKERGYPFPDE